MASTPRAETLAVPLRTALRDIERAIGQQATFDPADARGTTRLALFDVYTIGLLPRLLQRHAPGMKLEVRAASAEADPRTMRKT